MLELDDLLFISSPLPPPPAVHGDSRLQCTASAAEEYATDVDAAFDSARRQSHADLSAVTLS